MYGVNANDRDEFLSTVYERAESGASELPVLSSPESSLQSAYLTICSTGGSSPQDYLLMHGKKRTGAGFGARLNKGNDQSVIVSPHSYYIGPDKEPLKKGEIDELVIATRLLLNGLFPLLDSNTYPAQPDDVKRLIDLFKDGTLKKITLRNALDSGEHSPGEPIIYWPHHQDGCTTFDVRVCRNDASSSVPYDNDGRRLISVPKGTTNPERRGPYIEDRKDWMDDLSAARIANMTCHAQMAIRGES